MSDNPIWNGQTAGGFASHYINSNKQVTFWIGSDPTTQGGDWRNSNNNSLYTIDKNVSLYLDTQEFDPTFENNYEDAKIPGTISTIINKSESILDLARSLKGSNLGQVYISKYSTPKTWKSTTPLKLESSLKFNFNFGSAGLWQGKEEVVKPILAIANIFAPKSVGNGMFSGPLPTNSGFLGAFLKGGLSSLKTSGAAALSDVETDSSLSSDTKDTSATDKAIALATKVQIAYNSAINQGGMDVVKKAGYGSTSTKFFCMQIGKVRFGPATVGSVKMHFDLNNLDSDGYPCAGTLTLEGINYYAIATSSQIANLFNIDNVNHTDSSTVKSTARSTASSTASSSTASTKDDSTVNKSGMSASSKSGYDQYHSKQNNGV